VSTPTISIVTSVHNGAPYLKVSLESVLAQSGVDFEVVAVDDGSTDGSLQLLNEVAARNARVRVFSQPHAGLTYALIRGCHEAYGRFIARHDIDDRSLPGRLAALHACLEADATVVAVSSWARVIGPRDELLGEARWATEPRQATLDLQAGAAAPYHGTVMFRADAYRTAGGYRPQFRFAQDWDLWLRLVEIGQMAFVPAFLYELRVHDAATSAKRRPQQERLRRLALECGEARRGHAPEGPILAAAGRISQAEPEVRRPWQTDNSYFVGKCLLDRRDPRALLYLRTAAQRAPLSWRAWAALLAAQFALPTSGEEIAP
jgi:glycosyltransferase involved in cell wall biosynthesis